MPTFYDRFSQLAQENGYSSPTALGEALGFSSSLVSTWKVRNATPRMNTITAIANRFGVSPEWLRGDFVMRDGTHFANEDDYAVTGDGRIVEKKLLVPRYGFDTPAGEVEVKQNASLQEFADDILRLTLFNGNPDITAEDLQEIRDYATVVANRRARLKGKE